MTSASSEHSDEPVHMYSLARALDGYMHKEWMQVKAQTKNLNLSYSSSGYVKMAVFT